MKQTMVPIRAYGLSDWKTYGFRLGNLRPTIGTCGIFFCSAGEVELEIDGTPYIIQTGDVCFYMGGELLRVLHVSRDIDGIVMEADADFILPVSNKVLGVQDILYIRDHPCVTLTVSQQAYLSICLQHYMNRINGGSSYEESCGMCSLKMELIKAGGQALFYELLMMYFTNRPLHAVQRTQKDAIFQRFFVDLFHYYRSEREVFFYADRQNLTPRYFSSVVKEKSGRSVLQWIVQLVISEAKQLLECSDLSIKEIAVRLNFSTQSFFGKYFKQYTGMSPREYREQAFVEQKDAGDENRKDG